MKKYFDADAAIVIGTEVESDNTILQSYNQKIWSIGSSKENINLTLKFSSSKENTKLTSSKENTDITLTLCNLYPVIHEIKCG